jgi:hypothetical protein
VPVVVTPDRSVDRSSAISSDVIETELPGGWRSATVGVPHRHWDKNRVTANAKAAAMPCDTSGGWSLERPRPHRLRMSPALIRRSTSP